MPSSSQISCITVALLLALGRAHAQQPQERQPATITISVAASLRNAMEQVAHSFSEQNRSVKVVFNFGASGALQQQIEQGAPVDIFLSASPKQMDVLEAKGLLRTGTRRNLLVNQVVLIAPAGTREPRSFADLADPVFKLIALGDPASVPAGDYGRQVLQSAGVWDKVQSKLILAKDVRQVLTYVETGNVDAGIVYASDARESSGVRIAAVADERSHEPVVYPAAVLRDAKDDASARAFLDFLSSPAAQEVFRAFEFLPGVALLKPINQPTGRLDLSPLWISVKTSAAATVLTFVLGLLAAFGMSRYKGRGKDLIDGILALPLVLPPTVIGFFLLLSFGKNSPLGQLLERVGLTIAFSWPATVIAATVVAFPLMYRTTLGAFEQVTPTLLQAARTLGASEWRVFRQVLFPVAWPGVMAGTVLAFARALGEFGATLMLAGNIPGRTQTMPVAIFFAAEGGEMNRAFGWVLLIVAVSLAVITLLNYWSRRQASNAKQAKGQSETELLLEGTPVSSPYRVVRRSTVPARSQLDLRIFRSVNGFSLDVSFQAAGGALGILGASGSGKSMTLRCIAGIESPDSGRIVLNERVLFDSETNTNIPPAHRRIGILFQDYALFPHLTVSENIAFGLNALTQAEQRKRVAEVAGLVHLDGLLGKYPAELSGGQKQRVALVRALAVHPDALLLDEPFSALDPHLRRQLEEQLRSALIEYDGAVLFITHDVAEAYRFCRDLIVLDGGKVLASGPRDKLFDRPGSVSAARLTGCKNISAAEPWGSNMVRVSDWNTTLYVAAEMETGLTHIGVRAHHVKLMESSASEQNVFPCWLVDASEAPHEVTLYVHFQRPPEPIDTPHLQIEIPKELWPSLKSRPQPWYARIPPEKVLLLRD